MKAGLIALVLGLGACGECARAAEAELEPANTNIANTASLQRGAKYFVNYCLGCHSAKYVRYNRLAQDLQLTEEQLVENLMFTGEQPFDTMAIAMRPEDAMRWFGIAPPDLSLIARSRGTDYLYTYLRSFYADPSSPTGVDNIVLRGYGDAARALGAARATAREVRDQRRARPREEVFEGFETVTSGELSNPISTRSCATSSTSSTTSASR